MASSEEGETSFSLMDMLEKLKKHRMEVATRENVPLYVVCRNDTLTEIVERLPRTEKELLAIKGVGPKTISKIKEKVFELVDRFDKCNISVPRPPSSSSSSSPSPSPSPSLLASSSEPAILSELSDSSESVKSMKEKGSNDNDNDCEDSLDAEHLQQAFKEPEPTDIKEIKDIKIAKEETPKIEKKKIEIAAESNSNSKTGGEGEDSLIEGLARLSLDSFIADKLPFPSEFKGNRNELMHSVNEDGNIVYDNREYIPDEWNTFVSSLERKYPLLKSIQADHPEGRRPVLTKKIKTQCWDKLPQTNAYIESGLRTQFRCDYYGNLVSIDAKDGSLCCFDPDHVFPWARGGLTTNSNLLAVQFAANRWGKSDKFMATLNRRDMLRGLTPLQFKNVLAYATKGEVAGTGRNDRNYAIQRVIGWLNNTPRNEQTISNFQTRYGTDCAGESLYNFFVERERVANLPPSAVPVPVPEAQQAPSDDSKGEDVQKPSWKERLANQLPIVSMHLHRDAAGVKYGVDVWGSKTYLVKDDVLKPFGMTYDYIEQCWNKKVSVSVSLSSEGEVEADGSDGLVHFEANLRDALGALGVELRVLDPRAPTIAPAPAQVLPVVPARVPARVVPVGISAVSSMPSPAIGTSDVIGASVASVASDASDNIVHMQSKTGPTGTVCSIEVWGLKTIEVKEDVLKPFGMTWDRTKKRWCKNGSTATIEENSKGINVNLVIDGVESLAFRSMLRTKLGKVGAVLQVEEAEQV